MQGKGIPSSIREKINESWLEGKGPRKKIANISYNFVRWGNLEADKEGNKTWSEHTDLNVYTENYKLLSVVYLVWL